MSFLSHPHRARRCAEAGICSGRDFEGICGYDGEMPVKVRARPGEPGPVLMKRFKKACDNERLRDQMKRAATYEKPSDMRRRKQNSRSRSAASR